MADSWEAEREEMVGCCVPPVSTCLLGRNPAGVLGLQAEGKMERGPKEAEDPEKRMQGAHPEAEVSLAQGDSCSLPLAHPPSSAPR